MFQLSEREKCAHLLRRFGFGASEAELNYYLQGGLDGAIKKLLNPNQVEEVFSIKREALANDKGVLQMQKAGSHWVALMLMTRRPLVEKMTLFWHNHFATGADKVTGSTLMGNQNDIFREYALGNFSELIMNVSKDAAMLFYLDGQENIKGHANENFAREIMELFTIGVGNYSEKDVQEAARAFTGWSYRGNNKARKGKGAEFIFKPALHDTGNKTVLGKTGNLNGEDVITMLCAMPRTAEFLTEKIWRWFVYDQPSAETLKPFVKTFFDSGLNISVLLETIMRSDEFYSERSYRKLIKNPADFTISVLRSLGVGESMAREIGKMPEDEIMTKNKIGIADNAYRTMKSQGLWLLYPPDVSGWKPGNAWISTATVVERIGWSSRLVGVAAKDNAPKYPFYNLFTDDTTPFGIAKKLCSVFDAPLTGAKLVNIADSVEKAMEGQGLTPQNANKVAGAAIKLIFGSPEFQFA
jgi:uncharacterized protein (DUF1800 family)